MHQLFVKDMEIEKLISDHITPEEFAGFDSSIKSVKDIIADLNTLQSEFAPDKSLQELFMQEAKYYKAHGMSAFDCGYCGKTI